MKLADLVFAAIAPHGYLALDEAVPDTERHLGQSTRAAMAKLGRQFAEAAPDVVVVLTPHHVHVEGAFAVLQARWLEGHLNDWSPRHVKLKVPSDLEFATALLHKAKTQGISVVGVSYGGNNPSSATAPLDWGSLIPLWAMGGRSEPPVPVVVVCPARDLGSEDHLHIGAAIARAAAASWKRVALIASADHGHGHSSQGPYGYNPASAEYDAQVCDLLRRNELSELLQIPSELVQAALADSFWQMLMLHGALLETGQPWTSEFLSYEVPTYFGMACVSFQPA